MDLGFCCTNAETCSLLDHGIHLLEGRKQLVMIVGPLDVLTNELPGVGSMVEVECKGKHLCGTFKWKMQASTGRVRGTEFRSGSHPPLFFSLVVVGKSANSTTFRISGNYSNSANSIKYVQTQVHTQV